MMAAAAGWLVVLFCLLTAALVLLLLIDGGVSSSCPESGGDHEWMHETDQDGWHLRCRACLQCSHGLPGVFRRSR